MANTEWADKQEDRLNCFAADIILFSESLPKSVAGLHVGKQLLSSGTSPAPNFAEARGAESTADFIHKLKIVIKELNETQVWLKIISKTKLTKDSSLPTLLFEVAELSKIISSSIRTAKSNQRSNA